MRDTCMTARTLQLKLAAVMQQQVYQDYTALANYAAPDRLAAHVPLAHKVNYVLQLSLRLGLRLPSQKTMGTMTALLMYVPGSCLSKLSGCLQSSSGFFFLQAMHTTCPQSPIRVRAGMTELDPQAARNMCVHMRRQHAAAVKDGELHAAFLVKREASKLAGEHLKEIACKSVSAWLF